MQINPLNVGEYMELITSEFAEMPLFNKYVEAFLNEELPISQCMAKFDEIFNLETAVGDQLDKLGTYVSLTRELPVVDPDIPAILPDMYFREVIKARIRANFWDGTMEKLAELITETFPDSTFEIVDGQDMTIQIIMINPSSSATMIALLFNGYIIPKPAGVRMTFTIMDNPLFGWDTESGFVKGWDEGYWRNA